MSLDMPTPEPEGQSALVGHDVCLATRVCRRCGASAAAIASGARAASCEPGVTGISWARQTQRLREAVKNDFADLFGLTVNVPLYRLNDLVPRGTLTGKTADMIIVDDPPPPFSVGGFRFPDGSLDDCSNEPNSPPTAA